LAANIQLLNQKSESGRRQPHRSRIGTPGSSPAAATTRGNAANVALVLQRKPGLLATYPVGNVAPLSRLVGTIINTLPEGLGVREVIMSQQQQAALQRYRSERDAATAWVRQLQATGMATKEVWLEFYERIRIAADQCLKESGVYEPTSDSGRALNRFPLYD
jgi:hypothetical protein